MANFFAQISVGPTSTSLGLRSAGSSRDGCRVARPASERELRHSGANRSHLHRIEGTADAPRAVLEDACTDHRRGHVAVAGKLLDGANVVASL